MNTLHTLLLPALLALSVASCSSNKRSANGSADSNTNTQAANTSLGGAAAGDSLFFFLERTPCFGACKAYRISVYRSGYARYEGRSNVEKEGMHEGRIGQDTLATLLKEAEAMGFFNLQDSYDGQVTDLPSTIVRIVTKDKDKRVLARVGTPPAFKAYVEQVETLLLPVPWRPIPAQH